MKLSSLLLMALCLPPLLTNAVGQSKQSQFQLKQCNVANPETTPRPVFPVPSRRQMLWNETEFYAFAEKALAVPEVKGLLMEAVNEHNRAEYERRS